MDYSTEQEFKKVYKQLKCKANCLGILPSGVCNEDLFLNQCGDWVEVSGGGGNPSAPVNSIQYNNAGAFQGDTLFTRNPSTYGTTIGAPSSQVNIGDTGMTGTGTRLRVRDDNKTIKANIDGIFSITDVADNKFFAVDTTTKSVLMGDGDAAGNNTIIKIEDLTQLVTISNVPTYADDAAANLGGLTTGQLYKTTVAGVTSLNIVP